MDLRSKGNSNRNFHLLNGCLVLGGSKINSDRGFLANKQKKTTWLLGSAVTNANPNEIPASEFEKSEIKICTLKKRFFVRNRARKNENAKNVCSLVRGKIFSSFEKLEGMKSAVQKMHTRGKRQWSEKGRVRELSKARNENSKRSNILGENASTRMRRGVEGVRGVRCH